MKIPMHATVQQQPTLYSSTVCRFSLRPPLSASICHTSVSVSFCVYVHGTWDINKHFKQTKSKWVEFLFGHIDDQKHLFGFSLIKYILTCLLHVLP